VSTRWLRCLCFFVCTCRFVPLPLCLATVPLARSFSVRVPFVSRPSRGSPLDRCVLSSSPVVAHCLAQRDGSRQVSSSRRACHGRPLNGPIVPRSLANAHAYRCLPGVRRLKASSFGPPAPDLPWRFEGRIALKPPRGRSGTGSPNKDEQCASIADVSASLTLVTPQHSCVSLWCVIAPTFGGDRTDALIGGSPPSFRSRLNHALNSPPNCSRKAADKGCAQTFAMGGQPS
jgi:hypothetical protein